MTGDDIVRQCKRNLHRRIYPDCICIVVHGMSHFDSWYTYLINEKLAKAIY